MRGAALLPLSVVVANLAGLAVSLLVPHLLPVAEYTVFALLWSLGQLLAGLAYEWLRFGVLRYAAGADPVAAAARRGVSLRGYLGVTGLLLALALAALAAAPLRPQAPALAAVAFFAACQGVFDGRQALARAETANRSFAAAWMLRSLLSLLLGGAAAAATGQGEAALLGLALSFPLSLILADRRLPALPRGRADPEAWRFLLRYGVFAGLATNLALMFPALLRTLAAGSLGLEAAGGALLGLDLSQKAVAVVGLAANVVLIQRAIRAAEFGGPAEQAAQAGRQIAAAAALVLPAALGFWLLRAPFADLVVRPDYRAGYDAVIGPASLAAGLLALRLFGLDSLFLASGRVRGAVLGPAAGLATALLLVLALPGAPGPERLGWACLGGAAAGTGVALLAVRRAAPVRWPLRDLGAVLAGCAAMAAVAQLLPARGGAAGLAQGLLACVPAYAGVVWALDAAGLRSALGARLRRGLPA